MALDLRAIFAAKLRRKEAEHSVTSGENKKGVMAGNEKSNRRILNKSKDFQTFRITQIVILSYINNMKDERQE